MSYPIVPESDYKMPEDDITLSQAVEEVFTENYFDEMFDELKSEQYVHLSEALSSLNNHFN